MPPARTHCATPATAVAAGIYDLVLVVGVEKLKDYGYSGPPSSSPSYQEISTSEVAPATAAPMQFALAATRYAHHYGLTIEELKTTMGKVAAKNHKNGLHHPKAPCTPSSRWSRR